MKALKKRGSHLVLFFVVLLVVGAVGGIFYGVNKLRTPSPVCATDAKNNYFNDSVANLDSKKRAQLQPVVASIQKNTAYQKDVNCLYIVSYYQLELGNVVDARKSFDQLSTLSKTQKVDPKLVQKGWSFADMKKRLEILEAQAKEFRKNFVGIN